MSFLDQPDPMETEEVVGVLIALATVAVIIGMVILSLLKLLGC